MRHKPATVSLQTTWVGLAKELLPVAVRKKLRTTQEVGRKARIQFLDQFYRLPTIEAADVVSFSCQPQREMIADDACMPPFAGRPDFDDLGTACRIALSLNAKEIIELGTAYGNLTANLCQSCPDARIHTVNAPCDEQTGNTVTYSLTREQIGRVYKAHHYESQVVQIFSNTLTLNLGDFLDPGIADLAIIDACHDTDYVLNDFHKVTSFMRPGGVVLLHDTHPSMSGHLYTSYGACLRLRRQRYDVQHLRNSWWAVWVKPS